MNIHKNARLAHARRLPLVQPVEAGEARAVVAWASGISLRTVHKWMRRVQTDGAAGFGDRSSRPQRIARQVPRAKRRQILRARHKRWSSLRIANHYGLPISTVVTVQRRLGLNRLNRLEPQRPAVVTSSAAPGSCSTST